MEKTLSLNYEEASALLDMVLLTYADDQAEASQRVIRKLSDLCRQFEIERSDEETVCANANAFQGRAA